MGVKLELKNIKKRFGNKVVLDGVNLTVESGESFVILGGSGTGKSVTLRLISTLMDPDEGEILLDGKKINSSPTGKPQKKIRDKVGFLFQEIGLFDYLPIWENVSFYHIHKLGMKPKEAKMLALEQLEKVGIKEDSINLLPSEISLGMKKRVGLARVLAKKPSLILIDEPTSGLDPIFSSVISELIMERAKEIDATTITITHDIKSAELISDRIGLLYNGGFAWCGTSEEFSKSEDPAIIQFSQGNKTGPLKFIW